MDVESTLAILRNKLGELEMKQDDEEEDSLEWSSLEDEICDVETALIRLERGIDLGAYQSVIDTVLAEKVG